MKKIIGIVLLTVLLSVNIAFAKEYKVIVDDKYVPYFEGAFVNENVTPEEWIGMQAINLVDQIIDRAYIAKEIQGKTRDEKIAAITSDMVE